MTPMKWACVNGHTDVVDTLRKFGDRIAPSFVSLIT